jgi:hypothetical protein
MSLAAHVRFASKSGNGVRSARCLVGPVEMDIYTCFGIEEAAMPEAPSDIDYTVDVGRHETMFRANTPKGEEFLGGADLTMSNEEAHTFIQDARAAGLTVKSFF